MILIFQKQFDKFMEYLKDSPNKEAYSHFINALNAEGYAHLAQDIESSIQVKGEVLLFTNEV